MAIAADEWNALCAYSAPAFDPVREPLPEALGPGDVLDDGSILLPDGTHMMHGCVWLREDQACAAAFYGWARLPDGRTGVNLATGEAAYAMMRCPA